MLVSVKRVYDKPSRADGVRILVDRLWPRGITKEAAKLDHWMKELAPSTELRKWVHEDPSRWNEFKKRYAKELSKQRELVDGLLDLAGARKVTLLFSAKNTEQNNATALLEYLKKHGGV